MPPDYFANHPRVSKFPWSIYHRPLERDLGRFLAEASRSTPRAEVLVLGGGYLHELPDLPPDLRLTAADIDDRVTRHLSGLGDGRLVRCVTIAGAADIERMGPFDAIYAKEVIEHVVDVERYLAVLARVLKPGGRAWFSTPNYGDPWLPLIESTVLEVIGRLSGYSRKNIHPTRLSVERLRALLEQAGFADVRVTKTPFRLALIGTGRRRPEGGSPVPA